MYVSFLALRIPVKANTATTFPSPLPWAYFGGRLVLQLLPWSTSQLETPVDSELAAGAQLGAKLIMNAPIQPPGLLGVSRAFASRLGVEPPSLNRRLTRSGTPSGHERCGSGQRLITSRPVPLADLPLPLQHPAAAKKSAGCEALTLLGPSFAGALPSLSLRFRRSLLQDPRIHGRTP